MTSKYPSTALVDAAPLPGSRNDLSIGDPGSTKDSWSKKKLHPTYDADNPSQTRTEHPETAPPPSPTVQRFAGVYARVAQPGLGLGEDLIPGMVRELTAWDVYNNEAKKVDTELVSDWRDSLNFLLIFVSIQLPQPW